MDQSSENLRKVVEDINNQKDVKFVVFTGDNIERANPKLLKSFIKEAKKLDCPFYVVAGDKDVYKLKNMSKVEYNEILRKNIRGYKFKSTNYSFVKNGVAFIIVDGSKEVIPSSSGYYKDDVLIWLNSELKLYPDKNIIILQHFPIVPPSDKPTYCTYKPEKYHMLLAINKNVKAIISGHFGVNKEIEKDGIKHISTAPAPTYRLIDVIDCETKNPTIWAQIKVAE